MINDIKRVCQKHKLNIKNINFNQDVSDIIDDIGKGIINRSILTMNHRVVMAELWNIEKARDNEILFKSENFRSNLDIILEDSHFTCNNDFINCNKKIPCTVVQTADRTILLNDREQKELADLGYGISSYKIRKGNKINEVYCNGKHPNLDTRSKQFCLDSDFLNLDLKKKNILMLEELLSHFNISDCFIPLDEKELILEVIT